MSDVFISYSRLDKALAGQLREARLAEAQEIWIDWESIPPSQAWWDEIKKGIAKANNFVAILSPASMASPICQMEIEYARELKKRIIPVLHQPYEREASIVEIVKRLGKPEETTTRELWGTRQPYDLFDANDGDLKHINFFGFGPNDDFAVKFSELLEIIRTDYEHKELHTTLELRALEWVRRGRDAGFLLLDAELEQARAWLASVGEKLPPATDLHRTYIAASEKRTRRLRTIRHTAVVGTVVAVAAIVFAAAAAATGLSLAARANAAATREAGANAQIAVANATVTAVAERVREGEAQIESLRLAALANDELTAGRAHPATLLSLAALNASYTTQADEVFTRSLAENDLLGARILRWHSAGIHTLTRMEDGRLYSLDEHGASAFWDVSTGRLLESSRPDEPAFPPSLWFSPDGRFILAARVDGTVELIDLPTDMYILTLQTPVGTYVSDAAFSPDGETVLTATNSGTTYRYETATGVLTGQLDEAHGLSTYSIAYSPDGLLLATGGQEGAALWDAETLELVQRRATDGFVTDVTFTPDSRQLITLTGRFGYNLGANLVQVWEVDTFELVRTLRGHDASPVKALALSDAETIVTADEFGTIIVWPREAVGEEPVLDPRHFRIIDVEYSPDGRLLLALFQDMYEFLWYTATYEIVLETQLGGISEIAEAAFSPDSATFAVLYTDGSIDFHDSATGDATAQWPQRVQGVSSGEYSPDGRALLIATWGEGSVLLDAASGATIATFGNSLHDQAAFSTDGTRIVIADSDTASVWDTQTGERLFALAVSSDDSFATITSAEYSPDGAYIVTGDSEGHVTLWEAATGQMVRPLEGHTETVTHLTFSPDSRLLVTVSFDRTAIVWDVAEGRIVRRMQAHNDTITSATFSPDSQRIATGGWDDVVIVWNADIRETTARVCRQLQSTRDFTETERDTFGLTAAPPTCPELAP